MHCSPPFFYMEAKFWTLRKKKMKNDWHRSSRNFSVQPGTPPFFSFDHKRNEEIFDELKAEPVDEKLRRHKSNWLRQVTRMDSSRTAEIMLNYTTYWWRWPERPSKRLLDGAGTGLSGPNSWRMMMMMMTTTMTMMKTHINEENGSFTKFEHDTLTLNPLTWRIWWAPNNASRWQMRFHSSFKGLMSSYKHDVITQMSIQDRGQTCHLLPWSPLSPSDRWLQSNGGVATNMAKANSLKPSTVPLRPLQLYIKWPGFEHNARLSESRT